MAWFWLVGALCWFWHAATAIREDQTPLRLAVFSYIVVGLFLVVMAMERLME